MTDKTTTESQTTDKRPCPVCGLELEPKMVGFPPGRTVPWHLDPAAKSKPCPGSMGAFGPSLRPLALESAETHQIARNPAEGLYKPSPRPARKFLTHKDPDENIRIWLTVVEKQTEKPFQIPGASFCVVEEAGESVEAETLADREDALTDSYVATVCVEELIKRESHSIGIEPKLLAGSDPRTYLEILAILSGRLASYCRKSFGKDKSIMTPEDRTRQEKLDRERATKILDASFTAKAAIKRELHFYNLEFETSMSKVLDILDKRLVDGYRMSSTGSAIKKADS